MVDLSGPHVGAGGKRIGESLAREGREGKTGGRLRIRRRFLLDQRGLFDFDLPTLSRTISSNHAGENEQEWVL